MEAPSPTATQSYVPIERQEAGRERTVTFGDQLIRGRLGYSDIPCGFWIRHDEAKPSLTVSCEYPSAMGEVTVTVPLGITDKVSAQVGQFSRRLFELCVVGYGLGDSERKVLIHVMDQAFRELLKTTDRAGPYFNYQAVQESFENAVGLVTCPICGSSSVTSEMVTKTLNLPYSPEVSYEVRLYTCGSCHEQGDFAGDNSPVIREAIGRADRAAYTEVLRILAERQYSFGFIERIFRIPFGTLRRWQETGPTPEGLALLKLMCTYPDLLDDRNRC